MLAKFYKCCEDYEFAICGIFLMLLVLYEGFSMETVTLTQKEAFMNDDSC